MTMRNRHDPDSDVNVAVGGEFDWYQTSHEYKDVKIVDDHPLDSIPYHVPKGVPVPAKAVGPKGRYKFECSFPHGSKTNPHVIIIS
jgi:hypothetical protein